ncbi:NAD(P)H-hydrate dehydratase [Methylopila sp. Yamaguchi]|uniref:NAD(P)H-hydrate dehydratase n=1 Tax=Methylopila sp. Yamaguchi TaxID=1437817 RepID=UPI000CCBDA1C|nr:NAD(P)H-hydrate dehydratase [Methylopila sp. Yamaguchi]
MAEADRRAPAAGASGAELMEAAGRAVADAALDLWPLARRVIVMAGPGNNGGDGYVAARLLAARGLEVAIAAFVPRGRLTGDAAAAAARWQGPVVPLDEAEFSDADIVVDALFGAGLSRALEGAAAEAAERLRAIAVPTLAVDVPSGLDGNTGQPAGQGPIVRADATVTFVRLKPGHVLYPGRGLCGRLVLADIGMPQRVVESLGATAFLNRPALWRAALPRPKPEGHKYGRGHCVVWTGPEFATGAARLSAVSALRAGAGAVTLIGPPAALRIHAAHVTAVMLRPADDAAGFAAAAGLRRTDAAVVGPGAGEGVEQIVRRALDLAGSVVLDADAFTAFAGRPGDLAEAIATRADRPVALTPHEGEFGRLFGDAAPSGSKLERAREAAARLGAVVVLKGPDTVVASPDGRAAIADNAPAYLATAGAGDVLAGITAGLLAQGAPVFEAAAAAVWIHGEAATRVGRGLIADDLPGALPEVLAALD